MHNFLELRGARDAEWIVAPSKLAGIQIHHYWTCLHHKVVVVKQNQTYNGEVKQ